MRWQFWESAHWDPACAIFAFERVVKKLLGKGDAVPSEIERGTQLFNRCAEVLEGELSAHPFVAGDRLTVADVSIGAALVVAPHAAIRRWQGELAALPGWKQALALQPPLSAAA